MILDQIDNYLCLLDIFQIVQDFTTFFPRVFFQKIFLSSLLLPLLLLSLSISDRRLLIINNYLKVVSFIFYQKIDGMMEKKKYNFFFLSLSQSDSPNNRILWQNRVTLNSILGISRDKITRSFFPEQWDKIKREYYAGNRLRMRRSIYQTTEHSSTFYVFTFILLCFSLSLWYQVMFPIYIYIYTLFTIPSNYNTILIRH